MKKFCFQVLYFKRFFLFCWSQNCWLSLLIVFWCRVCFLCPFISQRFPSARNLSCESVSRNTIALIACLFWSVRINVCCVCSLWVYMSICVYVCVCLCVWEAQGFAYERPGSWALWRGGADTEFRHTYSSLWSREFIKIAHAASSAAPEPQPASHAKQTGSESDVSASWCSSAITSAEKHKSSKQKKRCALTQLCWFYVVNICLLLVFLEQHFFNSVVLATVIDISDKCKKLWSGMKEKCVPAICGRTGQDYMKLQLQTSRLGFQKITALHQCSTKQQ